MLLAMLPTLLFGAEPLHLTCGFEDGTAGFRTQGEADFALDEAQGHTGGRSLRITLPPGATPQWQQWYLPFGPVAPGDEFQLAAWVRTTGIEAGGGAYMALEFLDAAGQRAGIEHSKINLGNGAAGWERLTASAVAPKSAVEARANLILHSQGTAWFDDVELRRTGRLEAWPDLGAAERRIVVHPGRVVQRRFGGVGYHAFHHVHAFAQQQLDEVVWKRWRELRPSFARLNDANDWDEAMREQVARHLRVMRETGTELYIATWGPRDVPAGEPRAAYARDVADRLEWLIRERGLDNIRWFCLTNELSMGEWGSLLGDLPKFADYHRQLHAEFARRGLDVGLLATDASPLGNWSTIDWAAEHMDDVTAVYGGHHYLNNNPLDDERFYPWFAAQLRPYVELARAKGKEFILGEFGPKQDGRTIDGIKRDVCIYWDTPEEPMVAVQLCEAALAAMNAGVHAMGNWTFMDFPDDWVPGYINKWGLFKWHGDDMTCRPHYIPFGLMSRYFRGGDTVVEVEVDDPYLRAGAVRNPDGAWSIIVVNRYRGAVPVNIQLDAADLRFRRWLYDPAQPRIPAFGDLPAPDALLLLDGGSLRDSLPPNGIAIYTSAYDETPPTVPTGLRRDGDELRWAPCPEGDLCYYRVFGPAGQLGSTVATHFGVAGPGPFRVVAVDTSGNAGTAALLE